MHPIILFAAGIIGAVIYVLIKKNASGAEKAGIFLLYLIVTSIGLQALFAFAGHAFEPDFIAEQIGWPTGSPFQFEIAIANLSYGILGLLCIWFRGKFWIATVTGNLIFLWGAAYGHFVQMAKGNDSPYNSGIFLYAGDIIIPFIIFLLMIYYFFSLKKEAAAGSSENS